MVLEKNREAGQWAQVGSGHKLAANGVQGKKSSEQGWSNIVTSHPENLRSLPFWRHSDLPGCPDLLLALSRVGARCLPKVPSTINHCMILRNVAGIGLL